MFKHPAASMICVPDTNQLSSTRTDIFTSPNQISDYAYRTGQLADKPTRGQSTRGADYSQLAESFDLKFAAIQQTIAINVIYGRSLY